MLSTMEDTAFDVSDTTPEPTSDPAAPVEADGAAVEVDDEPDAGAETDDGADVSGETDDGDANAIDAVPADEVDLAPLAPPPTAEELAIARADAAEAALAAAIAGTEVAVQAAHDAAEIAAAEAADVVAALKAELAAQAAAHAEALAAQAAQYDAARAMQSEDTAMIAAARAEAERQLITKDSQLGAKDVLIAQLREHLAAADARYAALRADLAATTPWYVDIQPKNAGPRARKRLIVVAKDMQRATTKATGYAQGADVLAIAGNTEQVLLFDV